MRWLLLAAAGIVGWQLFVPPVRGLADQADFKRTIGKFGYGPERPASLYGFINLKYVPDPLFRAPGWEQFSSEDLFVGCALFVHKTVSKDQTLDLRLMGLVHAFAFLAAFASLLYAARTIPVPILLWLCALLVATDAAYVVYFNSFYTEPASYIFSLLLIAESIAICQRGASTRALLRWSLWAVLLVLAKPLNAPLGAPLAIFAMRLRWRSWTGSLAAAGILSASLFSVVTAPEEMLDANAYNLAFMGVLAESKAPAADAIALGFAPGTEAFSGTGAWNPDTGYYALRTSGIIGRKVTLATVLRFYLVHPLRLWRHICMNLRIAMLLRPNLGNFDPSTGYPPLTLSRAFSLWSKLHQTVMTRAARLLFLLLPVPPVIVLARIIATRKSQRHEEFLALLFLSCLVSFMTASLGDGLDTIRHMFLFNVLLDASLLAVAASASMALVQRFLSLSSRATGVLPLRFWTVFGIRAKR
jgi:hypothetical protein